MTADASRVERLDTWDLAPRIADLLNGEARVIAAVPNHDIAVNVCQAVLHLVNDARLHRIRSGLVIEMTSGARVDFVSSRNSHRGRYATHVVADDAIDNDEWVLSRSL